MQVRTDVDVLRDIFRFIRNEEEDKQHHNQYEVRTATASRNRAQESFSRPIVTEITAASTFYPATISHQDYYRIVGIKNPYCRAVIAPKLKKLKLDHLQDKSGN